MIKKVFSHIGVFFLNALSLLPFPVLLFFAHLLYFPLYYVFGYRRAVVRKNLLNSFPDKSLQEIVTIEKQFYWFLSELIFEIIKMSTISKKTLNKHVKFKNLEIASQYFERGESVLACSGHTGNWEICMLAAGINMAAKPFVIYKPINNKIFEKWFNDARTQFGNVFIPMRQTLRSVVASKNETTLYCFASDQTPTRGEVQHTLNFMHQPTAVLLGLEKIALQTNRPVIYFDITRVKSGYYEVECIPLALVPANTANHEITSKFFDLLTNNINRQPAYWLWSHRRWKLNNQ